MTIFIKGCIDDLAKIDLTKFKPKLESAIDYNTRGGLLTGIVDNIVFSYEIDPKGFFVEVYI